MVFDDEVDPELPAEDDEVEGVDGADGVDGVDDVDEEPSDGVLFGVEPFSFDFVSADSPPLAPDRESVR